jgi:hypothetical protein
MLEQSDKVAADADVVVYEPRTGFRFGRSGNIDFNFTLKAAPKDSLSVEITDSAGAVVRTIKQMGRVGLNRVTWDLRYDGPKQVELRTIPPDNPRIWEEARFKGKTTRPIIHWGIQQAMRVGPLATQGRYTKRLTVNGKPNTQRFQVVRDPAIPSTDADLAASTKAQIRIRDAMNETVDIINRIEVMRKKVEDELKANEGKADVVASLKELDKKMLDVELMLLSRTDLHSDDKWYVEKYRTYMNLVWLAGEVGTGASDVAGGADYRPTDAQMSTIQQLEQELGAARVAFKKLLDGDIKAFNDAMAGKLIIMDR